MPDHLSLTSQWRYDNDVPFPPLAPFVDGWNRLGLQPTLRLTTATEAVMDMEKAVGAGLRTLEGEWTDWWANGDASGPREVAASRLAKRYLAAALSPVWGPLPAAAAPRVEQMTKDLCLFDEHTWGANVSVSQPDSLDTVAQYNEKSLLAYKPMGHAEWLLGQRARTAFGAKPEGDLFRQPRAHALHRLGAHPRPRPAAGRPPARWCGASGRPAGPRGADRRGSCGFHCSNRGPTVRFGPA